jgi:outer membrane protein insertion porin family
LSLWKESRSRLRFVSAIAAILLPACALAQPAGTAALAQPAEDAVFQPAALDVNLPYFTRGANMFRVTEGFSGTDGSFIALSKAVHNLLRLGETLHLTAEVATRERKIEFGLTEPSLRGTKLQYGFTVYGQRFHYRQERESSITALQRTIPIYNAFDPTDLIDYRMSGYGFKVFAGLPTSGGFGRLNLTYTYDISAIRPETDGTLAYFDEFRFQGTTPAGGLTGIRTSSLSPSWTWNTVDNISQPTKGAMLRVSATVAGLGGTVNMIEPDIEAKYFHSGVWKRHVIALHFHGGLLTGYGGKSAPPYDRFYMGGEDDVRGFDSWTIAPVGFIPTYEIFPIPNPDGSQRIQRTLVNGVSITVPVTLPLPIYRGLNIGGDTNLVANVEYRIPLYGPLSLVFFDDVGVDRVTLVEQLRANIGDMATEFPSSGFTDRAWLVPDSQNIRMSSGAEIRIVLPKLHVPLRFYWAYNPLIFAGPQPTVPLVFDPSTLPNGATVNNVIYSQAGDRPPLDQHSLFRFAIGRTF